VTSQFTQWIISRSKNRSIDWPLA